VVRRREPGVGLVVAPNRLYGSFTVGFPKWPFSCTCPGTDDYLLRPFDTEAMLSAAIKRSISSTPSP
jgi:hypothetical protein